MMNAQIVGWFNRPCRRGTCPPCAISTRGHAQWSLLFEVLSVLPTAGKVGIRHDVKSIATESTGMDHFKIWLANEKMAEHEADGD